VPLAQGKKIGAWSLTEPEAGFGCRWDENDGGAGRQFSGSEWAKTFTTTPLCGHLLAMAVTDKSKGSHGISAFILKRACPGSRAKKENKLGMRASDTSEVIFTDLPRCRKRILLGPEGEGFTGQPEKNLACGAFPSRRWLWAWRQAPGRGHE